MSLKTGQAYHELEEFEAAEACYAKGMEYATRLLHSNGEQKQSPQLQEWAQEIIELYLDRIRTVWALNQQVRSLKTSASQSILLGDRAP